MLSPRRRSLRLPPVVRVIALIGAAAVLAGCTSALAGSPILATPAVSAPAPTASAGGQITEPSVLPNQTGAATPSHERECRPHCGPQFRADRYGHTPRAGAERAREVLLATARVGSLLELRDGRRFSQALRVVDGPVCPADRPLGLRQPDRPDGPGRCVAQGGNRPVHPDRFAGHRSRWSRRFGHGLAGLVWW